MRARSSKPPMMLPIRIHSEMGIARPFSTSSTVYRKIHEIRESKHHPSSATPLQSSYLPPDCSCAQSDEVRLLRCEAVGSYYPH